MREQQLEGRIFRRARERRVRIAAMRLIVIVHAVIGHARHHDICPLMIQHHVLIDQNMQPEIA